MNARKIRLEKGYSVPYLSKISGLSVRTIENVEKRNECTISTAKKLATALEVSLDNLCNFNVKNKKN